jgi:hypothetical protein
MFLCHQDEWRTGLKALRADSISKLKKAFPELVQEVIPSPQIILCSSELCMSEI